MKHVYGCLIALLLSTSGFAQDQAPPQDLNVVIKAIKDGVTTLQQNLFKGKRYKGVIEVNDVTQNTRTEGKTSKPVAVIESVAIRGTGPNVVITFSIDDLERATKINKRSEVVITGTLESIVHRTSGYINLPGYEEVRMANVVIENDSKQ